MKTIKSIPDLEKKKIQSSNPSAIPNKAAKEYLGHLITARFIMEVHKLELEGFVENRSKLEADLELYMAAITKMRNGRVTVNVQEINLLASKYGGDVFYIIRGIRKIETTTGHYGVWAKPKYAGYRYPYRSEAHPDLVRIAEAIDKDQGAAALGLKAQAKDEAEGATTE